MAEFIGRDRRARRAYGFDEIALVPGEVTLNPDEVDIQFKLADMTFEIPFLASAMDGVVDPKFAAEMGRLGGLAVLNLEGIYTRYDDYESIARLAPRIGLTAQEADLLARSVFPGNTLKKSSVETIGKSMPLVIARSRSPSLSQSKKVAAHPQWPSRTPVRSVTSLNVPSPLF